MAKLRNADTSSSIKVQQRSSSRHTSSQNTSTTEDDPSRSKSNLKGKKGQLADTLALEKNQQRKVSKETRKIKKKLKDGIIKLKSSHKELKKKPEEQRGLVYVGHIPHGFYEEELREYFKQFGKVTNVKLCRSRVSGNSKGYGYVEFLHPEVAKIAAETMDNYVMFKKRIVTEYVPYEKRPKGLFHGKSSNRDHTSVKSRRGKQKYTRNRKQDEKTVAKKTVRGMKKLKTKMEKLKNLGIQCNLIPVDVSDKTIQEIKIERKSLRHSSSGEESQLGLKKPSSKQLSSKSAINGESSTKDIANKSVMGVKSNRAILTKSLDSVKTLLSKKSSNTQDEETQTPVLRQPKKERARKGIGKIKKEPKLKLNTVTVKKIARELIRKRGNPLINLKTTKPKKVTIKKK